MDTSVDNNVLISLDKLDTMARAIDELSRRYHTTATELVNLQNKPDKEPEYQKTIQALRTRLETAQNELSKIEQVHKVTCDTAQNLVKQNQEFEQTINALRQENAHLKQKNSTAIERAELISKWLKNIDEGKAS